MPWMMFGGIFIKISDTPEIFRWFFDISFMKHAMEGIVHCVYGLDRPKLHCPKVYDYYYYYYITCIHYFEILNSI